MGPAIPNTPEEGRVLPVGTAGQESRGQELRLRQTDAVGQRCLMSVVGRDVGGTWSKWG